PSRGAGAGHLQEAPAGHGGAVGLHQSRITHRRPPSYSWERRRTDVTRRQKRLVFLSVWGPVCQAVFPPYPRRHAAAAPGPRPRDRGDRRLHGGPRPPARHPASPPRGPARRAPPPPAPRPLPPPRQAGPRAPPPPPAPA